MSVHLKKCFQTTEKLENHIKSLEKLEYDMLQKVFNMFVDIPENLALNIPGLRDPSSIPHLKRVRQKIKNKLKFARAQLKNNQELLKKVKISSTLNDILTISDEKKSIDRISKNIAKESYNPIRLDENCFSTFSNPEQFSYSKCEVNQKINKIHVHHKFTNKSAVCTITSSDIQENNVEINYDKSDISFSESQLKSSNSQILNRSMFYVAIIEMQFLRFLKY